MSSYGIRPTEELPSSLLDLTEYPKMPHNYPTNWRQRESQTCPAVCLLIDTLITATYSPGEVQHSKFAFELLSTSALLQDRLGFSLGASAVNRYRKIAQQESCFNKIKGKNKYCACLGIADNVV